MRVETWQKDRRNPVDAVSTVRIYARGSDEEIIEMTDAV